MGELNAKHNRAVWVDIPVAELDRAVQFYSEVLAINVSKEQFGDIAFAVLEHGEGNGGCLVVQPENVSSKGGLLVYMNVDGNLALHSVPGDNAMRDISLLFHSDPRHPLGNHYDSIAPASSECREVLYNSEDVE